MPTQIEKLEIVHTWEHPAEGLYGFANERRLVVTDRRLVLASVALKQMNGFRFNSTMGSETTEDTRFATAALIASACNDAEFVEALALTVQEHVTERFGGRPNLTEYAGELTPAAAILQLDMDIATFAGVLSE